jgi:hypothetical protein
MRFSRAIVSAALLLGSLLAAGPAAAQDGVGFGIKGGVTYPDFSTDDLELDNRTGWQAGLFFGGNRNGVVGLQGEVNWVRHETDVPSIGSLPAGAVRLDYIQVPVLLRLNAGTKSSYNFDLYGIVGPSFEVLVRDEVSGFGGPTTSDYQFENVNVGLMFGGGIELSRFILEARYSKGLRTINKDLDISDITVNSFAVLAGLRFN